MIFTRKRISFAYHKKEIIETYEQGEEWNIPDPSSSCKLKEFQFLKLTFLEIAL